MEIAVFCSGSDVKTRNVLHILHHLYFLSLNNWPILQIRQEYRTWNTSPRRIKWQLMAFQSKAVTTTYSQTLLQFYLRENTCCPKPSQRIALNQSIKFHTPAWEAEKQKSLAGYTSILSLVWSHTSRKREYDLSRGFHNGHNDDNTKIYMTPQSRPFQPRRPKNEELV